VHYIRILCALYHVAHAATPNVATSTSIDWFASIPLVNARALEYIHRYTLLPSLSGSKTFTNLTYLLELGTWSLGLGPRVSVLVADRSSLSLAVLVHDDATLEEPEAFRRRWRYGHSSGEDRQGFRCHTSHASGPRWARLCF
jgi:hypothetical protein